MTITDTIALIGAFVIIMTMAVFMYEAVTGEDEDYDRLHHK